MCHFIRHISWTETLFFPLSIVLPFQELIIENAAAEIMVFHSACLGGMRPHICSLTLAEQGEKNKSALKVYKIQSYNKWLFFKSTSILYPYLKF